MSIKRKINKDEFSSLNEAVQALYVERDGAYVLYIDDDGALKRAKDREAQEAREAKARVEELEQEIAKLESLKGEDARKRGDINTLEKSWEKKLQDREKELLQALEAKNAFISNTLVDSVAKDLAHQISTSPALIMPHIKARLSADLDGDNPQTKVLDASGKPSALTIDELKQEFVANKDFSAIIIGSKASGSGTPKDSSAQSSGAAVGEKTNLSSLSPKELAEHIKSSKE